MYSLNTKQAEGLAGFFFDVAKGLVLGGIGFTAFSSTSLKITTTVAEGVFAAACIIFALNILEGGR